MKKASLLFEDRLPEAGVPRERGNLRRGLLLVVLIFLGTRAVTWSSAYYGTHTLFCIEKQLAPPFATHEKRWKLEPEAQRTQSELRAQAESAADYRPLCRFDGQHYRSIIDGGYRYAKPPEDITRRNQVEQNIAFFPLFPLTAWPLTSFLSTPAAMILVVHLAALAAAIVLFLWVRRRIDQTTALFSVAAAFCWPTACFYSFAYAESLTLLLFVATLWLVDRRAFLPAAIVSGLATATRPTALPIVGVFMLAYWFNAGGPRPRRLLKLIPLTAVAAGGILSYAGYLTVRFGSPLVYLANFRAGWVTDAQRGHWLEYLTGARIWEQFKFFREIVLDFPAGLAVLADPFTWNMPLNFFILFLSLAGLGRVPRSFRPLLLLGPLMLLLSYLASGGATFGVQPMARYMSVSMPAFVVLAAWCTREWKPGARTTLLALLLLVQAAWAFHFGLREWAG